jgi:hypothetical protein
MTRGGKFLASTTMLAVAACGGQQGKLEIRSTPTALAQGKRPVPQRIAEARGQLALGNVALALEAFRIAAREDPNSADALVGMAVCYDRMGRFDLSRRNYETALALAPGDVELLGAFAASLQLQGRTEEALSVRQEIAARSAAAAGPKVEQVAAAPAPVPAVAEVKTSPAAPAPAVTLAEPVQVAAAQEPELAPRTFAAAPVNISVATPERVGVEMPAIETARVEMAAEEPVAAARSVPEPVVQTAAPPALKPPVQTAALGPSVTIKLPPARRVQEAPAPVAVTPVAAPVEAPPKAPAAPAPAPAKRDVSTEAVLAGIPVYTRPVPKPSVAEEQGPRLERMSMGEIALITVPRPVWRATTVARSDRSTTVRFVPLRQASAQPMKVRLLNAARVNRLAARTRNWLNARGWRGLAIGNARTTRVRSVILYPAHKRALAQKLSAQFGFPLARRAAGSHVVVLLGSDAIRHPAYRRSRA